MEIWTGAFWDWLIYPENSSQIADPASLLSQALAELGGRFPEFVFSLALDYFTSQKSQMVGEAEKIIEAALPQQMRMLLGFAHTNCLYAAGFGCRDHVLLKIENLQKSLEAADIPNTIGVAFSFNNTLSALRWAAQRAVVAQRSKVKTGRGKVYLWQGGDEKRSFDYLAYYAHEEQLCASIRTGEKQLAEECASSLDRKLFEQYQPLSLLRIRLQEVILRMGRSAIDSGVAPEEIFMSLQNYLTEVGAQYDYERLQGILVRAAREFSEKVWQVCFRQGTDVVQRAKSYIKKHAKEEFSLEKLAREIGTSASYLSRRFKLDMGKSITAYLNELRIEEAKRLLLDESYSITDVAFQVGYGSVQHFGRTFHGITGCSPSEWRKINRKLGGARKL